MVIQEKVAYMDKYDIIQYTISNKNGFKVSFLNYGGAITEIITPDKFGNLENIVLKHEKIEDYFTNEPYFGALVGRVAGRIRNGEFSIDGTKYHLTKNDGNNSSHGGMKNFTHSTWDCEVKQENVVELKYNSFDGEEGYPGDLRVRVTYELNNSDEFIISYEGISDKKTIFNPTSHSYFNLSGNNKRNIFEHCLTIGSNSYVELKGDYLPTGKLLSVDGSIFDLRRGKKLREIIMSDNEQIVMSKNGLNHPFILDKGNNYDVILSDDISGREVRVKTDTVGVVIYTGNELPAEKRHYGICIETQGLPDAINNPHFPSVVIKENEIFRTSTIFKFGIKD